MAIAVSVEFPRSSYFTCPIHASFIYAPLPPVSMGAAWGTVEWMDFSVAQDSIKQGNFVFKVSLRKSVLQVYSHIVTSSTNEKPKKHHVTLFIQSLNYRLTNKTWKGFSGTLKKWLVSVHVYSGVHLPIHIIHGARKTRPCLTGHPA